MGDAGAGEEPAPVVLRPIPLGTPVPGSARAPRPDSSHAWLRPGPAAPRTDWSRWGANPVAGFVPTGCRWLVATWSYPPFSSLGHCLETRRPTWRPDARWGGQRRGRFERLRRIKPPPKQRPTGYGIIPCLADRLMTQDNAHGDLRHKSPTSHCITLTGRARYEADGPLSTARRGRCPLLLTAIVLSLLTHFAGGIHGADQDDDC